MVTISEKWLLQRPRDRNVGQPEMHSGNVWRQTATTVENAKPQEQTMRTAVPSLGYVYVCGCT